MSYKKELKFLSNNELKVDILSYNYEEGNGHSPEHPALDCLSEWKEDKFIVEFENNKYEISMINNKNIDHYHAQEEEFINDKTVSSHTNTITINNMDDNVEVYVNDLLNEKNDIPEGIESFVNKLKTKAISYNIVVSHNEHRNSEDDYGNTYRDRGGSIEELENEQFYAEETNEYYDQSFYESSKKDISDDELSLFEHYVELKNELSENKELIKDVDEVQLNAQFKHLTTNDELDSENYFNCEKKIFAFIEIDRINDEIKEMKADVGNEVKENVAYDRDISGFENSEIKDFEKYLEFCTKERIEHNKEVDLYPQVVENLKKELVEKELLKKEGKQKNKEEIEFELIELKQHLNNAENLLTNGFKKEIVDYKKIMSEKTFIESTFERFDNHAKKLTSMVLPEMFFENKTFANTLSVLNLKEINKVLMNSEDPSKLLTKISKLSDEAQIETIYGLSNNKSLVENFLKTKILKQDKEEINKSLGVKKIKR